MAKTNTARNDEFNGQDADDTTVAASTEVAGSSQDFGGDLLSEDQDDVLDEVTVGEETGEGSGTAATLPPPVPIAAAPTPTPPVEPSSSTPVVPTVPAATTVPGTPVAPPLAPLVVPPVVAAPAAAEQPMSLDALRESYRKGREETEKLVASQHYKLTDEQAEKILTGDKEIIPQLMARVYMDAVTGAVAHMVAHLPQLMEGVQQSKSTATQAEESFFRAWPQLNAKDHADTIKRFGQVYRQVNPTASADDFIRDVGAQVVVALKLPQSAVTPSTATPIPPPAKPFRPAKGGAGRIPATAPSNLFEQLALEPDVPDDDD